MRTWTLTREQTDAFRLFLQSYQLTIKDGRVVDVDLSTFQRFLPLLDAERPYIPANRPCPEFERDFVRFIRGFGFSRKFLAHIGEGCDRCAVCGKALDEEIERCDKAFEELGKMMQRDLRLACSRELAGKIFKPNIIPSRTRARARALRQAGRGFWPF